MGSAIGHDIMEKGMGLKAEKPVRVIRLAILAGIQITTLTAYYLPSFFKDGAMIVANGTSLFFGLCARRFPQWPGGQRRHPLFIFEKVSKPLGLCEAFFGVPSLGAGTPFKDVDPLVFAVPVSLLFTLVASLLSTKPSAGHLAACFPDRK
jgi:SSS family solute:Na+ symporter